MIDGSGDVTLSCAVLIASACGFLQYAIRIVPSESLTRKRKCPGIASKGQLSNPTTAAQPWRRELVLMPPHLPFAIPAGIIISWVALRPRVV